MLRFSNESVTHLLKTENMNSFNFLGRRTYKGRNILMRMILIIGLLNIGFLFLPWTQNVRARGELIALLPGQRPQAIQTIIPGKIEKWYVQEGDHVNKGDTIIRISEVKDEYFDPKLLANTQRQIEAKKQSRLSYQEKSSALDQQIDALENEQKLTLQQATNKLRQAQLKVTSDSMDLQAEKVNFDVAKLQYDRFLQLYNEGLKSLTELESRKLKWQESKAKLVAQENKLLSSQNEVINARIELNRINTDFQDKISKARSEKFQTEAGKFDADALISKMENTYANYVTRAGYNYILAPQSGYITKAMKAGIGEIVKEGTSLVTIMPDDHDMAVEMYVRPIDLPLVNKGARVMIQFDGWPAIVFSGWPGVSYGTYIGQVTAMDNFISPNNLYRVLVRPDESEYGWPRELKVGMGVKTITFLNRVPVWYEIWRQINGFPPDFYHKNGVKTTNNSKSEE